MTKKLEELLNLPDSKDLLRQVDKSDEEVELDIEPDEEETAEAVPMNLMTNLEEADKISAALPMVKGLGDSADKEFDDLARRAKQSYEDLMDLGMNVEARYSVRMFEVAAQMMNAAIQAKSAKIDKKLKMVDLQIKKLAIDKKNSNKDEDPIEAEGYVISDRNSLLEKLKKINK
jgi:hypothetical protein